ATALASSIADPAAAKIVEWAQLRHGDSGVGFDRYAAFIRVNPDWPVMRIRGRAEARLWQEQRDGASVRRFVGNEPARALGRLAGGFAAPGYRRMVARAAYLGAQTSRHRQCSRCL